MTAAVGPSAAVESVLLAAFETAAGTDGEFFFVEAVPPPSGLDVPTASPRTTGGAATPKTAAVAATRLASAGGSTVNVVLVMLTLLPPTSLTVTLGVYLTVLAPAAAYVRPLTTTSHVEFQIEAVSVRETNSTDTLGVPVTFPAQFTVTL